VWVAAVIWFLDILTQFYVRNIHKLFPLIHNTLLTVTKTNLLGDGKQIVTVHCDRQVKPISASSGYNEETFNVVLWHVILPVI
jgi:hypothetical protein